MLIFVIKWRQMEESGLSVAIVGDGGRYYYFLT